MLVHLLKLAVGCESIADLEASVAARVLALPRRETLVQHVHTTRMVPKRVEAILDGGSLYWVIKGQIAARERILALHPFTDDAGIGRCRIVLEPFVVSVMPRPCRPFQGWRYMDDSRKPADLGAFDGALDLPEALRHALSELCLL